MDNQQFKVTPDLYASRSNRFVNYIVDKLIFYALIFGLSFLIGIIAYTFFSDTSTFDVLLTDIENIHPMMDRLLTAIIFIIFYMISEILLKGRTIVSVRYTTEQEILCNYQIPEQKQNVDYLFVPRGLVVNRVPSYELGQNVLRADC